MLLARGRARLRAAQVGQRRDAAQRAGHQHHRNHAQGDDARRHHAAGDGLEPTGGEHGSKPVVLIRAPQRRRYG